MNFPDRYTDHPVPPKPGFSRCRLPSWPSRSVGSFRRGKGDRWGLEDRDQEVLGDGSKKDEMAEAEVREGLGLSPKELKAGT